ncbi:uncharacterized protein ARMOST_17418 [Armillaria ostoyae]|uniref:Uncharacterized protein n=1 Tax=Armillaria ostoyae TaxID=47428 RepID=A0A284RZ24_ARMOS|nr:uncharacterized protein ARMOST_17418 [Armillaria ostoyae]
MSPSSSQRVDSDTAVVDDDIEIEEPGSPLPLPEPEPAPAPSEYLERSQRNRMIPRRFQDYLPAACIAPLQQYAALRPPTPPLPAAPTVTATHSQATSRASTPESLGCIETEPNVFGLYRQYKTLPSFDSDDAMTIANLCDAPTFAIPPDTLQQRSPLSVYGVHTVESNAANLSTDAGTLDSGPWFAPFMNPTICRLMHWFYSTTTKTLNDLNRLVQEVILALDFSSSDLQNFDANREAKRLDTDSVPMDGTDGWFHDRVTLHLPQKDVRHNSEQEAPTLDIPDVWHRSILDVVRSAFQDESFSRFHLKGFKQMWLRPDGRTERVYGEAYTSDVFLEMEDEITPELGCTLETVVVPMMVYSDSTCLANFGTVSLWPGYLGIGLMSKYFRAVPSFFQSHHLVYFPVLLDNIQDVYMKTFGLPASKELLLDADFMETYEHGIIIECADGILRRIYPRFFTYSADYPEKVLLASIKSLGRCLCPRCLVVKEKVLDMGMKRDLSNRQRNACVDCEQCQHEVEMVRRWIFERGYAVSSKRIENVLSKRSNTANRNAFSTALLPHGFNFYQMLVPDLMHESESGSWKSLFTHLIRICHEIPGAIQRLNKRFRSLPTFGRSTIRKFSNDVSGQKKFAARDYEDVLQCSFPCFDGLLPDSKDNSIVMDTLFISAMWHAFAKARMHTDSTVQVLRAVTSILGRQLRLFSSKVCPNFRTKETPSEMAARVRRLIRTTKKKAAAASATGGIYKSVKAFNLFTYKHHALGDYQWTIPRFGTTDSYSTQIGEQEHHRVKLFYARTNKRGHVKQIAVLERRQRRLRRILAGRISNLKASSKKMSPRIRPNEKDPLPKGDPESHYQMSLSRNYPLDLHRWLAENEGDLAVVDFIPKLKEHILRRLFVHEIDLGDEITPEQLSRLHINNDRIFRHKVLRVNYTTYDVRRDQDSINPRTRSDVVVLANDLEAETVHPYWYARIIRLFHADVRYNDPDGDYEDRKLFRVDFAWVRWYGFDSCHRSGFTAKHPHHIGFVDGNDPGAFGFLDPDDIIRAVHLLPVYRLGQTTEFLPPSIAQRPEENDHDYERYSVDIWVDRDMIFHYCGLGVGHQSTWDTTRLFREDLCKAYNLPHNLFSTGDSEDVEMAWSEDNSDGNAAEEDEADDEEEDKGRFGSDELEMVNMPDEEAEADGWDDEDDASDAEDDDEWETDSDKDSAEDEEAEDIELDDDAEGELDDLCDDDDNEMGLEVDLHFASL